jgi:dCMP deaminase
VSRPSLDSYYLSMLPLVASRGTCLRRKVAAILVDDAGKLVSMGYNGVPRGIGHCTDYPCPGASDKTGDNTRCLAIHAETNAIMQAADSRRVAHTLYCSCTPCFNCSKLIISAGIKDVVALSLYRGDVAGCELLDQAGIMVTVMATNGLVHWKTILETNG